MEFNKPPIKMEISKPPRWFQPLRGGSMRDIPDNIMEAIYLLDKQQIINLYNVHRWQTAYFKWFLLVYHELSETSTSSNMNPNADVWVRERRLRPVYELLDSGNNKKVMTEVDKLLKKQPMFTCAKVLKALALIRLNKPEEADAILEPIYDEVPTDDGTIQALSICYRELDKPEHLSMFLEAACKKEQTEELLTHSFMAHVRINEFQKQHITAMTLYRMYNKANYFGWAIASLIIKYEQDEKKEALPLVLAERMIEKYINEQKVPIDDTFVYLYVVALEHQDKYDKMLDVLTKYGHPQPNWSNDEFHRFYCNALKKLNKMDELFEYMKATFFKKPEEYDVLKQMIMTFGESHKVWVQEFLDHLLKNHPSRVVALADMSYTFDAFPHIGEMQQRVEYDLELAIRYGAEKPSFSSDIAEFQVAFNRIDANFYFSLLEVEEYDTMGSIIKDVNYELFARAMVPDTKFVNRLVRANRCFGKYLLCEESMKTLRSENNMRTKESDFFDQFIIIAAGTLLCELYPQTEQNYPAITTITKQDWTTVNRLPTQVQELYKTVCQRQSEVASNDVPVSEISGKYMSPTRIEYVLLLAAALLEYGLERSPHNHTIRILLARVYSIFGANNQALKLIQGLDLKHIQWDTLGYLMIREAITGGLYNEAHRMLLQAENMYIGFKKESMEHIITCYKYSNFSKVSEFLSFRDQIFCSTQYKQTLIERRFMEILAGYQTPADMKRMCESIEKDLIPEQFMIPPYGDNRDFTVLEGFIEESSVEDLRRVTTDMDIHYLKIRASILFILSKLVAFAPNYKSQQVKVDLIKALGALDNYLSSWASVTQTFHEQLKDANIDAQPLFNGFWPPSCSRYFEMGTWSFIYRMARCILQLGTDTSGDPPALDNLADVLKEGFEKILNHIRRKYPEEEMDKIPFLEVEEVIEEAHYAVESFSFFRMIIYVTIQISKERLDQMKPSGAKKKGRAKGTDQKKQRTNLLHDGLNNFRELQAYVNALHDSLVKREYEDYNSTHPVWKTLLKPSFLYSAFPSYTTKFLRNLKESHEVQMKEICKTTSILIEFLRCIQL